MHVSVLKKKSYIPGLILRNTPYRIFLIITSLAFIISKVVISMINNEKNKGQRLGVRVSIPDWGAEERTRSLISITTGL